MQTVSGMVPLFSPRPYYFVVIEDEKTHGIKVSTEPRYFETKNKRRSKGDFEFHFNGNWVPKDLAYTAILGEDIDQFRCNPSHKIILPIANGDFIFEKKLDGQGYVFLLRKEFRDLPLYDKYEDLFNEMERDWERHRGDKFSITNSAKDSSKITFLNG